MNQPQIHKVTWPYFQKILGYHGIQYQAVSDNASIWGGDQLKIVGFDEYNFLLDINSCFSSRPSNLIRDRSESVRLPFKIFCGRPWTVPKQCYELDSCFELRVKEIESKSFIVNLLWSGGIDSTAMVVAWLKYRSQDTHVRIMYSIDSIKENSNFFLHLQQQIPSLEMIELGGKTFSQKKFDGILVTGGAGDDITASVDESWFNQYGIQTLKSSWRDYFWKRNSNHNFIDFCEQWFAKSGRPIDTVLEARWWLYINKMNPPIEASPILSTSDKPIESFFYDPKFEAHFFYRINSLFADHNFKSYKQGFKNFIHNYFPDNHYRNNKCKENSGGWHIFLEKFKYLNNIESIMSLSDGTKISTDNLPFLSQKEYRSRHGNTLDYIFYQ